MFRPITAAVLTLAMLPLTASVGFAETGPFSLTYEEFEISVPHIDLENCPLELASKEVFCRATLNHDEIHVFAFDENGDSPLVGFKSYEATGLEAVLK